MSQPSLANAELAVMEVLWDTGPLTARRIRETLYPDAERTRHGTVQRLLQRLEDKGFVVREGERGGLTFRPTLSREDHAASRLEDLAATLTGGSLAPMLTHLIEQERLSSRELDRLRAILDEAEGRTGGGR